MAGAVTFAGWGDVPKGVVVLLALVYWHAGSSQTLHCSRTRQSVRYVCDLLLVSGHMLTASDGVSLCQMRIMSRMAFQPDWALPVCVKKCSWHPQI